jgi:hypothetical protein
MANRVMAPAVHAACSLHRRETQAVMAEPIKGVRTTKAKLMRGVNFSYYLNKGVLNKFGKCNYYSTISFKCSDFVLTLNHSLIL